MNDLSTLEEDPPGWDAVLAAGQVDDPDPALLAAVRAALADQIRQPTAAPARRWRTRRLPLIAGLAAAVVAATFLVPWLTGPGAASPAAADVLSRAADAINPEAAAHPGQFWQIESIGTNLNYGGYGPSTVNDVYRAESRRTVWLPVGEPSTTWMDDTRRIVKVLRGKVTLAQAQASSPGLHEVTRTEITGTLVGSWQQPTDAWLATLPRQTAALRDRLYADTDGHGQSSDGEVLVYVADALRSGRVPADLRAALYRVLTTVPGVELTSTRATVLGRPGVALGRLVTVDGQRQEIVIDPRTGELVGERTVNEDPKLTTESSVRRTLVDQVPAAIRARATVQHCNAGADGAVTC